MIGIDQVLEIATEAFIIGIALGVLIMLVLFCLFSGE